MEYIFMFIEYARKLHKDEYGNVIVNRNAPYGVLICEFDEDGQLWFGWSLCNLKHDQFNKKKALEIAKGRLAKHPCLTNELPRSLRTLGEHMKGRIYGKHYTLDSIDDVNYCAHNVYSDENFNY